MKTSRAGRFAIAAILPALLATVPARPVPQEALKGRLRPDHGFSDPLGLELAPSPDAAMDIEARVPPGEDPFSPLWAQELLIDQKRQDFPGEDLGQTRIVQMGDPVEDPGPVHSPFGHQEMQMRVEVDPVAGQMDRVIHECVDGGLSIRMTGEKSRTVFEGAGRHAGLELVGDMGLLKSGLS